VQKRDLHWRFLRLDLLAAAVTLALASCSVLVDESDRQCRTDTDCARFKSYPFCKEGICVPSGLGPPGCFLSREPPMTQQEFANACTTAKCTFFDSCGRLNRCDGDTGIRSSLVPPANLGMIPPLINPQPEPAISCADPILRPNVIYVTGSTNFPPLQKAVQPLLSARSPSYTLVFQPQTSCRGAGTMFDPDPSRRFIRDVPNNWAFFYDANGVRTYCKLSPMGNEIDVGQSDVFARTCGFDPVPGVADYVGPIQAITFVVPAASTQTSISAEAAHLVFGAGGKQGAVLPWTNPYLYFVRSAGTGTIQLTSRAIEVPANAWWGIDRLSSDNLRDSMEGVDPASAEQAIGVLSSDFADQARANLRILAFQASGQTCGYLPDSSSASFDKNNVRDGHYPIWGPIHLYAPTTNGVPSPAADALVTRFAVPRLDQRLLDAIVAAGYIPACAMRVRRDQEMGPMVSYQPQFGCGCYFDNLVNGRSTCSPCSGPGDCPSERPACNYGFCEIR
jgi:hypothetical protein